MGKRLNGGENRVRTGEIVDWAERDDELRRLWASDLSTLAMAQEMRISKNALVGRAHRLGLPARPSPIIRTGVPQPKQLQVAARQSTLRSLVLVKAEAHEQVATQAAAPPATRSGRSEPCCYPIGEPGTKEFRYCDEPSEPGKPYCYGHCCKVYASYGAKPADELDAA